VTRRFGIMLPAWPGLTHPAELLLEAQQTLIGRELDRCATAGRQEICRTGISAAVYLYTSQPSGRNRCLRHWTAKAYGMGIQKQMLLWAPAELKSSGRHV
jgi:hypothetical protein